MEQQALVPYQAEQINLIKQTVAKGVTDLELKLFLYQAQRTGLDPLSKQIHAIKRWNKKLGKEEMAIQTGIDGYRLVADRTEQYAGSDDAVFPTIDGKEIASKATVTVWKLINGVRCSFTASARWEEYYPGEKQGFMWDTKPFLMLSKCAEALALRKAFPQELSGVYTHEEMAQAGEAIDIKEEPRAETKPKEEPKPKQPTLQERKNKLMKDLTALNYDVPAVQNYVLIKTGKNKITTDDEMKLCEDGLKELQPPERKPGEDEINL